MRQLMATEAPWEYKPSTGKLHAMIVGGGKILALFKRDPNPNNAALMTASPKLYRALENMLETMSDGDPMRQKDCPLCIEARAALAEARGEV